MQWQTNNLHEFEQAIKELLANFPVSSDHATVVCLHGNLGAGKTTATQVIAHKLGVTETVQSPTFVIKKSYQSNSPIFKKLIHVDAYRITSDDNLDLLGFADDFKSPHTLMMIEWPEMINSIIPDYAIHVFIEQSGESRSIRLENKKTA